MSACQPQAMPFADLAFARVCLSQHTGLRPRLDEFLKMLPQHTVESHSKSEIRTWFNAADTDHSGKLSVSEFFVWSLSSSARKTGSGVEGVFRRYDRDGSGRLDELEFTQAVEDMGFGEWAKELFAQLPQLPDRTVNYVTIIEGVKQMRFSKSMQDFFLAMAWDGRRKLDIVIDDTQHPFTGSTAEDVRHSLLSLLERNDLRLSDVFREMDDDGSNSSRSTSSNEPLRRSCDSLAMGEYCTRSSTGRWRWPAHGWFSELQAGKGRKTRVVATSGLEWSLADRVEEEDAWDEERLRMELKRVLESGGVSATEMVRTWSDDGNNVLSKSEFLKHLKKLVGDAALWYSEVRGAAMDAFESIDMMGAAGTDDGNLDIIEVCQWLDGKLGE